MTARPTHQPEEETPPATAESRPGETRHEIARLSTLVAQLALLIEDTQRLGNTAAEYSLQVQYHQASAALLGQVQALEDTRDPQVEALRRRHQERAKEYQRWLDEL